MNPPLRRTSRARYLSLYPFFVLAGGPHQREEYDAEKTGDRRDVHRFPLTAGCPILFVPFAKRVGDGTHPGSGAQKK